MMSISVKERLISSIQLYAYIYNSEAILTGLFTHGYFEGAILSWTMSTGCLTVQTVHEILVFCNSFAAFVSC